MNFKWSKFKQYIFDKTIIFFSKTTSNPLNSTKVLIVSNEALGDTIIKSQAIKILSDFYGKDNIYILCKDKWKDIYLKQGYSLLIDEYKKVFKRILFFRKLNKMNFKKIIFLNHVPYNHSDKFIICQNKISSYKNVSYILENYTYILKEITGTNYKKEDLRPDLKSLYKNDSIKNTISIGIGASNQRRTLPIEYIKNLIELLLKKYPEKKIILLGTGKKQVSYTKELLKKINYKNIINKVDTISLNETLEIVANSDLFLGYDSGLTNSAFCFHTKYICFHWSDSIKLWLHDFPHCVTLIGDGKNPVKDNTYGTDILNSIKLSQVEEALNKLKI